MKFNKDPYEYLPSPSIVFVITVFNNEKYIAQCLESIVSQNINNWRCIVVDDASTDFTWNIISQFMVKYPSKITATSNNNRKWKIANFIDAISDCKSDDVIVEIDGDDYILHNSVALELTELHSKFDVVWTQHEIDFSICPDWHTWYSTPLPDNWTRLEPWRPLLWTKYMHPGHLRTFKKKYFDLIRNEDFCFDGEYLKAGADAAYYTAIIELTPAHLRYFYDRSCLCYRITQGGDTLNELFTKNLPDIERQTSIANYIKSLPPYEPIKIFNLFVPIYEIEELKNVFDSLIWVHKHLPFIKIYIGVSNFNLIELPLNCGICAVYNIDKIMHNSFVKIKDSKRPFKELSQIVSVDYIFRNTNLNHLIVVSDTQLVYNLKKYNFDVIKWTSSKDVVNLQKTPEILSSMFKYLRDETFMINKNPTLRKLVEN